MENRSIEYQSKWQSEFGNDYQTRNSIKKDDRNRIWFTLLNNLGLKDINSVLEVGCSRGHNLYAIKQATGADVVGVEINEKAIKERYVNSIVRGSAYDLPFIDSQFDLVYTAGVLIHLSDAEKAMKEIYRVSYKYILSIEYFDDKERKIEYRDGVYCSAKPFDRLWLDNFDLDLVELGNMKDFGLDDGTDFSRNCKYAIFKKP